MAQFVSLMRLGSRISMLAAVLFGAGCGAPVEEPQLQSPGPEVKPIVGEVCSEEELASGQVPLAGSAGRDQFGTIDVAVAAVLSAASRAQGGDDKLLQPLAALEFDDLIAEPREKKDQAEFFAFRPEGFKFVIYLGADDGGRWSALGVDPCAPMGE